MDGECSTYMDRKYVNIFVGKAENKNHSEYLGVNGMVILKRIVIKQGGRFAFDSSGSAQGQLVSSCQPGNIPLDYINGGKFLDQFSLLSASQKGHSSMDLAISTDNSK